MDRKHILVVGTGSAGQRHAKNLASLGCRISCMDPRPDRLEAIKADLDLLGAFTSLEDALNSTEQIDGVVVASPPVFHMQQSIASLEKGLPVLLEKPVSPDISSAKELERKVEETGVPLLLGYTYRWWPPLRKVQELLRENAVGKIHHARFVMSAHLADWHPWENYWDFFMASRKLGGGALLDESHWIDLMLLFFGQPDRLIAGIDKISDLKIDTDDNVDLLIVYSGGLHVSMHLDLYGRPHEKYVRLVGEEGTVYWTMEPNRVSLSKNMSENWESCSFDCERNEMFLQADREFLDIMEGSPVKTCTIQDGVRVLKLIEAARKSSRERRWVEP